MKPSRICLSGGIAPLSLALSLVMHVSAAPINWTGATNGTWSTSANWNPVSVPGGSDVATFSISTAPINVLLDTDVTVAGLETLTGASTNVHTLLGNGTDRTLTIGASGINHYSGGLTIGGTGVGQKVDVILADAQKWNSSRTTGNGTAQAIFVNNSVTLAAGLGAKTLELTGTNTGSYIGGVIGNGAGSTLNILKTGTGVWTLNGVNTYSGTTQVNEGTLRLGATGVAASSISVAANATLGFRVFNGTSGITSSEIDAYVAGANFTTGAFVGLDTSGGSGTYSGNYTAGHRLFKTGGNYLTLTGVNTPGGGTSVVEGGLILANATALSGNVSVATNAALIVRGGGSGFTEADITAFRALSGITYASTSYFGISTVNGDFVHGGVLPDSGTTRFTKAEANTLFLTGQNTYRGGTQIAGGILSVSEIKNGGVASTLGASDSVVNGIILAGGRLQYTGSGHTTDRLFNLTSSSAIEASGTGALVFNSTSTMGAEGAARILYLTGYSHADNRMGLNLANVTTGGNTTSIVKNGSGHWILSGNNTHTGATTVRGGMLTLDYTGGKTPVAASGSQVVVQNGTMRFLGSGAKTIGTLTLAEAENGFGILKVTGGMALSATSLTSSGNAQRHILIDLSGAGNSLAIGSIGTNMATGTGGVLLSNSNRANVVVKANGNTYGFAAYTGGSIQKLTDQAEIAAGTFNNVSINTANYLFKAGSYTTGASLNYQTITFDSTDGAINLNFAATHGFNSTGSGRGVLFTGTNDINFSGAGGSILQSTWLENYLDDSAALNISSSFGSASYLLVGGTGFTNYTGTGLAAGMNGEFVLNGGLFRYAPTAAVALNGATHRINSGVFEIGANLNNGTGNDLERTTANFRLAGDSGFSAHGAERKVSLGASVTWGSANFLTNTSNEDGDHTFRLSSARSNATVDFVSKIELNGKVRTVDVANGSADIDARLSGGVSGASGIASGLVKTGLGTLEMTGLNDYRGRTRIEGGRMLVGGQGLTATTSVHVANSTLGLMASEVINNSADLTLENGIVTTVGNQTETMGRLTLIGNNQLDLVGLGNIIRMADSSSVVWSSSLSIYNWNGNANGNGQDQFFVGNSQSGLTTEQESKIFFVNPEVDGVLYSGTFGAVQLNSGEIVAVIPEPASVTLLAAGASLGLAIRRRRR